MVPLSGPDPPYAGSSSSASREKRAAIKFLSNIRLASHDQAIALAAAAAAAASAAAALSPPLPHATPPVEDGAPEHDAIPLLRTNANANEYQVSGARMRGDPKTKYIVLSDHFSSSKSQPRSSLVFYSGPSPATAPAGAVGGRKTMSRATGSSHYASQGPSSTRSGSHGGSTHSHHHHHHHHPHGSSATTPAPLATHHRIYLSWDKAYPCVTMSVLRHDKGKKLHGSSTPKASNVLLELPLVETSGFALDHHAGSKGAAGGGSEVNSAHATVSPSSAMLASKDTRHHRHHSDADSERSSLRSSSSSSSDSREDSHHHHPMSSPSMAPAGGSGVGAGAATGGASAGSANPASSEHSHHPYDEMRRRRGVSYASYMIRSHPASLPKPESGAAAAAPNESSGSVSSPGAGPQASSSSLNAGESAEEKEAPSSKDAESFPKHRSSSVVSDASKLHMMLSHRPWDVGYHPDALDNPEIRQGRFGYTYNLSGLRLSILPYAKPKELRREINSVFREQHSDLPADLSLSKIRAVKKEMLERVRALPNAELSSVALAYVYFEKLVLKGVVRKGNRKAVGAACVLLALKFNQDASQKLAQLFVKQLTSDPWGGFLTQQILEMEFAVFAHLRFDLKVPSKQYARHLVRIMEASGTSLIEYAGEHLILDDDVEEEEEDERERRDDEEEEDRESSSSESSRRR